MRFTVNLPIGFPVPDDADIWDIMSRVPLRGVSMVDDDVDETQSPDVSLDETENDEITEGNAPESKDATGALSSDDDDDEDDEGEHDAPVFNPDKDTAGS